MGGKRVCGLAGRFGPPEEPSLGKPLLAEPKPLAIVDEELNCRSGAVAENKDSSREGIFKQLLATDPGKAVDAAAEINGLNRNKDAHLGSDLDHD